MFSRNFAARWITKKFKFRLFDFFSKKKNSSDIYIV